MTCGKVSTKQNKRVNANMFLLCVLASEKVRANGFDVADSKEQLIKM